MNLLNKINTVDDLVNEAMHLALNNFTKDSEEVPNKWNEDQQRLLNTKIIEIKASLGIVKDAVKPLF